MEKIKIIEEKIIQCDFCDKESPEYHIDKCDVCRKDICDWHMNYVWNGFQRFCPDCQKTIGKKCQQMIDDVRKEIYVVVDKAREDLNTVSE